MTPVDGVPPAGGPRPGPAELPAPACCLIVLDGWGLAPPGDGNAISLARTPVFDALWDAYPHAQLTTCGRAVGLPDGQMGNSEVGHMNLGAGAIVRQSLLVIDDAVADGSFAGNAVLRAALDGAERVHLVGLVSDGGVHSSIGHVRALIGMAAGHDVVLHAFTDGRDAPPLAGAGHLEALEAEGGVRIGSVIGRYFAMDRDSRWDRVQRAYDLLVHGRGDHAAATAGLAARAAYARGETDEFIASTVVGDDDATIRPQDSVICFNFRADRMREILAALADPAFSGIDRGGAVPVTRVVTLTEYGAGLAYPVAFRPDRPALTLSAAIAATGASQLHVAETEKYPHVTYFFNGGDERPQDAERREMVASPRDVATYDLKPEMSARGAAGEFVAAWLHDRPAFGIINFANADMVGHTGVIPAAVRAVETVDECLGLVVEAVHETGGVCIVTADHGNSDEMLTADGSPHTAHSLNPVPIIVTSTARPLRSDGILADVAPTALDLLGIAQAAAMTGRSMLA
ncbi:MAG TPA: 2,3-bisphosphoglycerate-independent phosphoglycerate mutase [Solirubrobacteraceae bacterium]|jgi:2,3-bisphosphoglycerate-independent phosphoglycerate mutase|nr:2,3-bisphosphoglycerate-independent phosphoglycerate mutase [Solirubrobacteraceae bacterium]